MSDPRGSAHPVGSGAQHPFLDALAERVLVLDGAFGTWMQGQDLGPDDFGGEALEGCNEQLVAHPARPRHADARRVLRGRRRRRRDRDVRRVPARAQRVRPRRPDVRDEPARGRARPRGRVGPRRRRPAPLRDRLDRARHPAAVARPDPVRRRCATTTSSRSTACIAGGVDVLLIETVYDLLQAKAAINGARAAMRRPGCRT